MKNAPHPCGAGRNLYKIMPSASGAVDIRIKINHNKITGR
jgi:hypothetical protein